MGTHNIVDVFKEQYSVTTKHKYWNIQKRKSITFIVIHEQIACEIDIRALTSHPIFGRIFDQIFGKVFDQIFGTRPEFPGGVREGLPPLPESQGGFEGGAAHPDNTETK